MKKLESSLKNMLLVLTLVSAVAAFLLAYVNNVTSTRKTHRPQIKTKTLTIISI